MILSQRLLSVAQLERVMRRHQIPDSFSKRELLLCTVMDYVELVEWIKKARSGLDLQSFCSSAVEDIQDLYVLDLDADRLLETLFEYSDTHDVRGIWPALDSSATMSDMYQDKIGRLVRRLILRPTIDAWWDADLYNQLEA